MKTKLVFSCPHCTSEQTAYIDPDIAWQSEIKACEQCGKRFVLDYRVSGVESNVIPLLEETKNQ